MGRIIVPGGKFVQPGNPEGKTADQILDNPFVPMSTWHVFQALSWVDLAKRRQSASALLYAAIELRYGLEYLLFELLVIANPKLTESEYKECIGSPKKIRKLLETDGRIYAKRAEFTKILLSLESQPLKLRYWDLSEIFRYWGVASSYLHFWGSHNRTNQDLNWSIKGIAEIEKIAETIYSEAQQTLGVGFMSLEGMPPEVKIAWDEFVSDKLSAEDLRIRMKILRPILIKRKAFKL